MSAVSEMGAAHDAGVVMDGTSTAWVATAYAALDIRGLDTAAQRGIECMVLPTLPCEEPIGLHGEAAELWLRLLDGPVADAILTDPQRALVREFAEFGLAAQNPDHPARVTSVAAPWLSSPLHEMLYALVRSAARERGIELVFIKGPALSRQGLRDREHSADIDVLVDPRRISELQEALSPWGWIVRHILWDVTDLSHSVTLAPTMWGCEIDLHRRFPGVGLGDDEAFAVVRDSAEQMEFAAVTAPVAGPLVNGLFSALHFARPAPPGQRPHSGGPEEAVAVLRRCGAGVIGIADRLGADAALEPHLRRAFPEETIVVTNPLPFNWTWLKQPTRARYYLAALAHVRWHDKPRLVKRLLWPTQSDVGEPRGGGAEPGGSALGVRDRLARLGRIFAAFRRS